jgi:hypothetical protein
MMAVILMLVGTFMSGCSLVLMKVGHKKVVDNGGVAYFQPIWLFGLFMMTMREVLHITAMSYGN